MDKRAFSERDICTKFITPALRQAGWDEMLQIREEVSFTKGRIIVRGKLVSRGKGKRADYILYFKPNIPLALIEAKGAVGLSELGNATTNFRRRLSNRMAVG
jgi:type I restriction enzyme, R subunit